MGVDASSERVSVAGRFDAQRERAIGGRSQSNGARAWRRFRANKLAIASMVVAGLLILMSFCAPLIALFVTHTTPSKQTLLDNFAPASRAHWFGTDEVGRDVLTRIVYGARVDLGVAFLAVSVAIIVGTLVGAVAGYYGRWLDTLLMRFVDVMLSIPSFFLLLLIAALVRVGPFTLAIVIALLGWFGLARLIRAEILSVKRRDYVEAARTLGASNTRIIVRHILPNVTHLVILFATGAVPGFILAEAALSFLGVGIQPPTPSWGNMLTNSTQYLTKSAGLVFIPGFFLSLTVLALTLIGYALRDALDPRLSK